MWIIRRGRLPFCSRRFAKKLLVYLFCRLVNCIYFALEFNTSYVAEWRGGGPHDLLRGFDSFRNCQCDRFLWQQWLDLSRVVFLHRPFLWPDAFYLIPLKALISPLVEESWDFISSLFCNSGRIFPANCLPSSTPHWSKVKMSQMTP